MRRRLPLWPFPIWAILLAFVLGSSTAALGSASSSNRLFRLFPDDENASAPQQTTGRGPRSGDVLEPLLIPKVDIYLPDGELDFRLSRLSRNALFEGRLNYDFPSGDISAFLRYRFYQFRRTYQLTVFDTIEGQSIDRGDEYQRIRGSNLLIEWPHDYHHRSFVLTEWDSIDSNKEDFQFTRGRTNTFVRFGYQLGTPDDRQSNAIVGETRGRIERLFSAHRLIGPGNFGVTSALSYASDSVGGDFDYLKFEFVSLKRFQVSERSFFIGRIEGGTFPHKVEAVVDPDSPEELTEDFGGFDIPAFEFFTLKGRQNLKGLTEFLRGTSKLQFTTEFFVRGFEDKSHKLFGLDWTSWYWVIYGGTGAIGFNESVLTDSSEYLTDVGLGFEASFRLRSRNFFLSAIAAKVLDFDDSPRFIVEIKTYR